VPALPSSVIDPLWDQFAALLPEHVDNHPLGCHRPRIPDRVIFDKLVHVLVWGAAYERIAMAPARRPASATVAMSGSPLVCSSVWNRFA
jgi:transposase